MSAPPRTVAANEVAFFFQTNEPVPALPIVFFVAEVERLALSKRHFGPDVMLELLQVETGTKLVKLSINQRIALAAVGVAAWQAALQTGDFVLAVAEQLRDESPLAKCVAGMGAYHGVVSTTIVGSTTSVTVMREEMRAYRDLVAPIVVPHSDGSRFSDGTGYAQPNPEQPRDWYEYFFKTAELGGRSRPIGEERGEHPIPRSDEPYHDTPRQRVRWIGTFQDDGRDQVFVREDGERFAVFGVDYESALPVGVRLFVTGSLTTSRQGVLEFYPERVSPIDR